MTDNKFKSGFSGISFVIGLAVAILFILVAYTFGQKSGGFLNIGNYGSNQNQQKNDDDASNADEKPLAVQNPNMQENSAGQQIPESIPMDNSSKDSGNNLKTALIKGKLCYPSSVLPAGEIAIKNIDTQKIDYHKVDGKSSEYEHKTTPGKFSLRYQAHLNGSDSEKYSSGYYTQCAINNNYENCNKPGAHDPIIIELKEGETVENVDLCDFYYEEEPKF